MSCKIMYFFSAIFTNFVSAYLVPRNLPFKDGVRILHPRLQERFGDENVDLALGVLEELIEVEEPPPFPASIYQRWKHDYLRRKASAR